MAPGPMNPLYSDYPSLFRLSFSILTIPLFSDYPSLHTIVYCKLRMHPCQRCACPPGQQLAAANIVTDCLNFAQVLHSTAGECLSTDIKGRGRIECLPVQWRRQLNLEVGGTGGALGCVLGVGWVIEFMVWFVHRVLVDIHIFRCSFDVFTLVCHSAVLFTCLH